MAVNSRFCRSGHREVWVEVEKSVQGKLKGTAILQ